MKCAEARVLLTGASGGIGQAMALALRGAGAEVFGVGRAASSPFRDDSSWVRADLTTLQGVGRVAVAAADWRVNVVVHAAGVPGFGALAEASPSQLESVLQVNLLAPMQLTQALLPQLRRLPKAQLIFVGSVLGRIGVPGFSVYGASKAGLHGFAEALRRELADTQVKVQILAPRSTRTAFNVAAVERYNVATRTAMDPPDVVARALIELIEAETAQRFLGFPENLAVRLNGVLGPLLDFGFVKHRRCLRDTSDQPLSREG